MAASSAPHEVGGFRVAPVKFKETSGVSNLLYFKEHDVRDNEETKPTNRTLFVVNVPPYCNQECLERLFGTSGPVESVILQTKPGKDQDNVLERIYPTRKTKGFKVAYVVFKHVSSIAKSMKYKFKEPFILSPDGEHAIATGYKKWCSEYTASWPDPKALQREVDDFMAVFDQKKQVKEEEEEGEGEEDEEGWVTVTKKSSKPIVARTERAQKRLQAKEKKKREERELLNFYTFQTRESKREQIADLRKKFEEDKQRIAQMRDARKFKPY